LPLASLYFFRFYENELIQKTELELITQSAVFSAIYREFTQQNHLELQGHFTPVTPQLDLSTQTVLPRRPLAKVVLHQPADFFLAWEAGQKMQKIVLNTQQITLAGIRIVDKHGIVIAGRAEIGESLAHIYEVQFALKGQYISVIRERISDEAPPPLASLSRGAGIRVFTAFPIVNKGQVLGVVYLSRTPKDILKYLFEIRLKVFILIFLLLGVTILIVLFLSSRLSRPIRELMEQTQKVTTGEIETIKVMESPGTHELADLSKSFAEMSQALRQRAHYIQQFSSHVSHEFKTPLTSMQGTLEVLQEHINGMSDEQVQRFLNNLQGDTVRLKSLVNRLLEQGRADVLQTSTEVTSIGQTLKKHQQQNPLKMEFDPQLMDEYVNISPTAFESVLSNLIDNSVQHRATHIAIHFRKKYPSIFLSVKDNGDGVSEANVQRIFTPFFTTRREKGGTGLGLGIIQSTLKAWGGSVQLKPSEKGALFEVQLKCADFKQKNA
ncbi:MAG: HAMP domain-containing histidine kinase, partial [Methylococcales bacterium]|nr:HAMP domain-containing histidine kinase [Methylococcales bacterium]